MARKEIKRAARSQISGSIFTLFLVNLVWFLIAGALTGITTFLLTKGVLHLISSYDWESIVTNLDWAMMFTVCFEIILSYMYVIVFGFIVVGLLMILLAMLMEWGIVTNSNKMYRGEHATFGGGFAAFKSPGRAFGLYFMRWLYLTLWGLIPVAGWIIVLVKNYSYSCAMFIAQEHKETGVGSAITRSRQLMDGRKWDLFVQDLSFILWMLGVVVTFGLLAIYVVPYYNQSRYNFYQAAKAEVMKN